MLASSDENSVPLTLNTSYLLITLLLEILWHFEVRPSFYPCSHTVYSHHRSQSDPLKTSVRPCHSSVHRLPVVSCLLKSESHVLTPAFKAPHNLVPTSLLLLLSLYARYSSHTDHPTLPQTPLARCSLRAISLVLPSVWNFFPKIFADSLPHLLQ